MPVDQLKEFTTLLKAGADLDKAALQIACIEYPDLEVTPYLEQLDAMAKCAGELLQGHGAPLDAVAALNQHLYDELGFQGNDDEYYDPRNSFLNDVIDRRLGIPITLAVIYREVARRLGLAVEGVSFPGHFLLRVETERGTVLLDPYARGKVLSREELSERLAGAQGPAARPLLERFLAAAPRHEILARMLRNLKAIYEQSHDAAKALVIVDHILAIAPDAANEVRDRGYLYEQLDCYRAAHSDYRRYLELEPGATDAEQVRARFIEMQQRLSSLH